MRCIATVVKMPLALYKMGPQSQKNVYLGTTSLTATQREAPNKLPFFTPVEGDLWWVFE